MDPVVRLGSSGLAVSRLCLGTMNFGTDADPTTSEQIAHAALDAGLFFWDTADMYGKGTSETLVGRFLQGRRHQVVLATKVFAPMGPGPNDRGLSARHIHDACDASLRRLQTDWIDLYYLHIPDHAVPTEESLRALEDLCRSGRVRYLGCSNYRAWEVVDMIGLARSHGWQPMTAVQPLYNLCNRDIEVELLPMCAAKGLGVVSYSPLARGILTGKYTWGGDPPADSRLARDNPRFLAAEWRRASVDVADALAPIAAERGTTMAILATAWALRNALISSVIVGPRSLAHLDAYLAAQSLPWDAELEAALDALVPPGCHSGRAFPDSQYPVTGRVPL